MPADRVEFKAAPAGAQGALPLPEAKVVSHEGAATTVTVDTTQPSVQPQAAKPATQPAEEPKATERPSWLPEEFKSPEEFAEAWKANKPQQADGTKPTEQDPKAAAADQASAAVTKAGLDLDALSAEYAEKGELSADSLSKLEKAGIGRTVVDQYIEGQKAQAAAMTQRLAESVGGQEHLDATLKWAGTALTAEEIEAANAALQSGNEAQSKLVLAGLNSRRLEAMGREPALVAGRASPGRGDAQGYESTQQMVNDMNSKAYKTDPAFREQVAKRLAASKF